MLSGNELFRKAIAKDCSNIVDVVFVVCCHLDRFKVLQSRRAARHCGQNVGDVGWRGVDGVKQEGAESLRRGSGFVEIVRLKRMGNDALAVVKIQVAEAGTCSSDWS